jgi:two-component system, cell cycle response regulator
VPDDEVPAETAPLAPRGRVLLVDDSTTIRKAIGRCLAREGYQVAEAANGRLGVELEAASEYDVVLTDLEMPELDGFGVLETVKARASGAEVIILTGTGATDIACAIRALRLGAHDYLTKPPASTSDEIVLAVGRAIEKKRMRETNARLMRELEALSRTDPLTRLLNRRVLDEDLARELAQARRYGHPVSLAMMDLDHFKRINDTHGHQGGDEVLRTFARVAQGACRDTDTVYRFGGEEFAALLPHSGIEDALNVANRVVRAAASTRITWGSVTIPVTVSIGVACIDEVVTTADELLAEADAALYQAKRTGRNRATVRDRSTP